MQPSDSRGRAELRAARAESRSLFWAVGLFSFFVNILMLTGPIFMLQVYDRVLGSRSEATLVALTALVAYLYLMMGILDYVRGRILARIGARFQASLDRRVFSAAIENAARSEDGKRCKAEPGCGSEPQAETKPRDSCKQRLPHTAARGPTEQEVHEWHRS